MHTIISVCIVSDGTYSFYGQWVTCKRRVRLVIISRILQEKRAVQNKNREPYGIRDREYCFQKYTDGACCYTEAKPGRQALRKKEQSKSILNVAISGVIEGRLKFSSARM